MDDETSDVSENDEEEFGWQVAASRRSRAKKKSSTAANAMPCNPQAPSGDTATGGGRIAANATAFKNRPSLSVAVSSVIIFVVLCGRLALLDSAESPTWVNLRLRSLLVLRR
ncbi:hypothetical protein MRX96_016056 [Rhipicephalus microplus]